MRVLALFSIAPFFGEKQIPKKSKIALALLITILISAAIPLPQIPLFSVIGCWILIQQVLIGLLMGLTMQIAFAIVRYAGEVLGMQMGLSFALFVDPAAGPNMPIIARFLIYYCYYCFYLSIFIFGYCPYWQIAFSLFQSNQYH